MHVIYTAYFVNDVKKLLRDIPVQLHGDDVKIYAHHVTKEFRPLDGTAGVHIGNPHAFYAYAQVVTDNLQVILVRSDDDQSISKNDVPHITLATKNGVLPSKSNDVIAEAQKSGTIQKFSQPIAINVTEGYFDGKDVHIS